ncbi:MAG: hypothetical protein R2838_07095 [Caldilineaceae bacterium]
MVFLAVGGRHLQSGPSKRLSACGGLGFAGKLLGIGAALMAPSLYAQFGVEPESLLVVNVGISSLRLRSCSSVSRVEITMLGGQAESLRQTVTEGWAFIKDVPSFASSRWRHRAIVAETALEYHCRLRRCVSRQRGQYQAFYSLYQLLRTVLTRHSGPGRQSRVIGRIGLKNSFLVLPVGHRRCADHALNPANLTRRFAAC